MLVQQTSTIRAVKGFIIANTRYQIKKITSIEYIVKSQSSLKKYAVSKDMGNWHCECPDHTYRRVTCKHIFAVQAFIETHKKEPLKLKKLQSITLSPICDSFTKTSYFG